MDHLDGTYIIGTDDESDDNDYVAPEPAGRQVILTVGNSQHNVISRRLANLQLNREETLPPQPQAATSAAAAAATSSGPADSSNDGASTTSRLSQTLTRLVHATWAEHRQDPSTTEDAPSFTLEERSMAEALWNSISTQPTTWIWPAPASTEPGFEPALVWTRPAPAGQTGYAIVHGEPLTGWEPTIVCSEQHQHPHLSLKDCITDHEKLFNGDLRLNEKANGQLPIPSFERLFFALWASRCHLLPRRNENNHFEARHHNEHAADFLKELLNPANVHIPGTVNKHFDRVVAGTPAPHFKAGDLRITTLRWYESCPASRQFLKEHISGPASMELPNLDLYRQDIRHQLRDLFQEYFADALDTLRLRVYLTEIKLQPRWRIPRASRQLPGPEDPTVWRIRPDRILDHENVVFMDSWGVNLAPANNACKIIVSGPADRALGTMQKYLLSHRVQNVYLFWGHDITPDWYAKLTEHFVRWFSHARLFILMPPYTRENDYYWSTRIGRGVLAELRDHCLNTTVICDPLDVKLYVYHGEWTTRRVRHGTRQYGYPPWPTEDQDAEGTPSADGLRRRKTYMKEKLGITLWDHEADDSTDTEQQAAGQREASSSSSGSGTASTTQAAGQREVSSSSSGSGTASTTQAAGQMRASPSSSGSGTAPPTLQPVRWGGTPPSAVGGDPDAALINRLREMYPNPHALQTQMLDLSRFLNVLHQLRSPVQTPTWLRVYPALSTVEALNLWGAYKHLSYSAAPQAPDSDADTDSASEANPIFGHPSVATAAGGRSPSDQPADNPRNPGQGHSSGATAAGDRSPPDTSDTTRTRTSSTEQRRGTPRASSRGPAVPRAHDQPRLGEGRRGH